MPLPHLVEKTPTGAALLPLIVERLIRLDIVGPITVHLSSVVERVGA